MMIPALWLTNEFAIVPPGGLVNRVHTEDVPPEFPRVERFLDYWTKRIEAVINQVFLAVEGPTGSTRFADVMFLLDDTRSN